MLPIMQMMPSKTDWLVGEGLDTCVLSRMMWLTRLDIGNDGEESE